MSKKLDLFNIEENYRVTYNMGPYYSEDNYELIKNRDGDNMWRLIVTKDATNEKICVGSFPSRQAFEDNFNDIYDIVAAIRESNYFQNASEIPEIIFKGDRDFSVKVSSYDFLEIPEVYAQFSSTLEQKVDVNNIEKLRKDLEDFSQIPLTENVPYVLMDGKKIWEGSEFIPLTQETLDDAQVITGIQAVTRKMEELDLTSELTIQAIPYEQLKLEKEFLPYENSLTI